MAEMEPIFRAVVSRRFSWRLMILAARISPLVTITFFTGWQGYPWVVLPFVYTAIVILHPVMDKDVPSLIGLDTLKSPRTHIAAALLVISQILAGPYLRESLERRAQGQ